MNTTALLAAAMGALPGILAMIGGIMFLILIHEFGHWIVARTLGFQTPVFSIGFGKRSWSLVLGKFWDTEFRLSPILLGGYVSIPELQDETTLQKMGEDTSNLKFFPVWKRMAVAVAGVVMNVLFAIVAIAMLFAILGKPVDTITATKIAGFDPAVTIAQDAGLKAGDKFVSVDGKTVVAPQDLIDALGGKKGQPVSIVVDRAGQTVDVTVTANDKGRIGVQIAVDGERNFVKQDAWTATKEGVTTSFSSMWGMLKGFGMMLGIVSPPANMPDGALDMHGIVGIVSIGAQAYDAGIYAFVWMVAMISLNLAIMNILPIPLLDGGHIMFYSIEALRGKPVPFELRARLSNFFFLLLLMLMFWGLFNDIVKPIQLPK